MWRDQIVGPAADWLGRDFPALAVDAFRILVGILGVSYFARLLVEFPLVSHPQGLIDHPLSQDVYGFTRMGLFQSWTPGWLIAGAYLAGLAASVGIAVGYRIRLSAAVALIVAASAYRWNFLVMYLDDAVVHLMFFWMLLLPTGRTLSPFATVERSQWSSARVSGPAVRCLMLNVCWIYFVAGVWKLDSILWREGFGLYAAMKVEVARMPDVWGPEHLPFLRLSDYMVLVVEPILPLPMLSSKRWLRLVGAVAFVVFNLFILATLGIAWAILGLTCTLVLFLGEDLAERWGRAADAPEGGPPLRSSSGRSAFSRRADRIAVGFLLVLILATSRHVPVFGAANEPAYAALWMVGVAQDYRLFNWIDRVAYRVRSEISVTTPSEGQIDVPEGAYPRRFRTKLLQAYAHDIRWLILPDERRFEIRLSIARRHASWFCRFLEEPGSRVSIVSTIHPIHPDNLDMSTFITLRLAEFECVEPGSVTEEEGGVPVPEGWPHLQARFIQGLNRLR